MGTFAFTQPHLLLDVELANLPDRKAERGNFPPRVDAAMKLNSVPCSVESYFRKYFGVNRKKKATLSSKTHNKCIMLHDLCINKD
jgi:hypothetical protein